MPHDHYVAQTYLGHFVDPVLQEGGRQILAIRPEGRLPRMGRRHHPRFPQEREDARRLQGDIRATVEDAITDLENGRCDSAVKMVISGYCGNLLVCTPAWTRVGVKMHDYAGMHQLRAEDALRTEAGKPDPKLKEMLAAFNSGRYHIETRADAVRASAARALLDFAWALYNACWTVIQNDTAIGFLTSDNPVAFNDPGPWRGAQPGLPRYLTLSPRLCLYGFMDPAGPRDKPDFVRPPRGDIQWGSVPMHGVERVNRAVAECAEEIVISSCKSDHVPKLVSECAQHRVDMEFIEIRQPDGFLLGSHTRVWEPPPA
jgi:hypothetical protein